MSTKKEISDRLLQARNILGYTQDEMAKKIGISRPTYIGYEKGIENISKKSVEKVKRNLKINEEWLLNGNGDMLLDFSKGITGGENPAIDKEFNEIRAGQTIINRLLQLNKKNKDIHNKCFNSEMDSMMIYYCIKHYGLYNKMDDSLSLFKNRKISDNDIKEDFLKHILVLKELSEIISPYAESLSELELKLLEFDSKHDGVYSIDDDNE